ncbi:MAG: hypothetical protein IKY33_02915 [Clostridia bacterium]|nr:hypothetical protein [Clostridia bacterium]
MKKFISVLLILLLTLSLCACNEKEDDTPRYSTKKASDDFSDLFAVVGNNADALAAITVTEVKTVTDIIEKYEVYDTTYTRITATVDREFTDQIDTNTVNIFILGTAEGFPQREELIVGRSYIIRLESWVHESGLVWLISPLESTYLRLFNDEILVHDSNVDLNYKRATTPDAFAESLKEYQKENPPKENALTEHYSNIRSRLEEYDYNNEELAYQLSEDALAARKELADSLK